MIRSHFCGKLTQMASRHFPLYNVSGSVGLGKPNRADDVQLVRAIFTQLARVEFGDNWLAKIPTQASNMLVTSAFDDTLGQWILAFQKFYAPTLKVDGIIDPLPNASSIALETNFKSGRISTLAMMCNRLWRLDQHSYMRIGDEQRVPWVPDPSSWHR
jgi:hypothetical protein